MEYADDAGLMITMKGNNMRKIALILLSAVLISGCSKGERREREIGGLDCNASTAKVRADYMLQCIRNANPVSDEEPEDWLHICEDMAEKLYCKNNTFIITEECVVNGPCVWVEINRRVKE